MQRFRKSFSFSNIRKNIKLVNISAMIIIMAVISFFIIRFVFCFLLCSFAMFFTTNSSFTQKLINWMCENSTAVTTSNHGIEELEREKGKFLTDGSICLFMTPSPSDLYWISVSIFHDVYHLFDKSILKSSCFVCMPTL